jgi:hypothetical protein
MYEHISGRIVKPGNNFTAKVLIKMIVSLF